VTDLQPQSPLSEADQQALDARRARLRAKGGGSIRTLAAGGVMINAVFSIGLQGLALARGLIVAAFLTPSDYGIWALIVVGYTTLGLIKQVGIVDKYIQQDDPDEEVAFQKAFTLEAILSGGLWVLLMILTPVLAWIDRAPEIILPGLVTLAVMPANVLQTPIWAFQREMEFRRQRTLSAVDPVVGIIVTVALAIAGAGYWSLAIGNLAGGWAGAAVIMRAAPYKLRFRYDRGTALRYVHFSTPILMSNISTIVLLQGTVLVARGAIGIAGIGAMSLANSIRVYAAFADGVISSAMYPAVCAMKDRIDLMHESFVKSNRLALMWGFPIGIGVSLFAGDLVRYMLGEQWEYATILFEAVGISAAVGHIAFNWGDYIRARGSTKPIAMYAWLGLIGWLAAPIPLMLTGGLRGYAIGTVIVTFINLGLRAFLLRGLFPAFSILPHGLRAIAPTVPAVGLVLLLRVVESGQRSLLVAAAELGVFLGTVVIVTWFTERALLGEAVGYLRRARSRRFGLAT
jgi:PST family polysaccharide transporter